MQHVPMSRKNAGFTMVELLVALVLLGLVSAGIYRVLVNNQRLYMAQTQRIDLAQNIRAAANILPAEFRELDAFDGDITAMSADSLSIRAFRWLSFVCQAPVLGGATTLGLTMIIRGGTPGQMGYYGSRALNTGTDSMLIYYDGDQTSRADDYWPTGRFISAPAANCPGVPAGQPGRLVTFDLNLLGVPGANKVGAITTGAPIHGYERVVYKLFKPAGDTSWYIGYRPAAQATPQPLIGPVLSNGLTFQYYDANGVVTAVRTQVARIDITVRARTAISVRSTSDAVRRTVVDSVVTSVALRNNRRF